MTPRMAQAVASSSRNTQGQASGSSSITSNFDFKTLGRAPLRLTFNRRVTSDDLEILESTPDLLLTPVPEADGVAKEVSLLKGFNATIPSSEQSKVRRRNIRNMTFEDGEDDPGLKRLGMQARGMLTEQPHNQESQGTTGRKRKKGRRSGDLLGGSKLLGQEELSRQRQEILQDKENLHVRRVCTATTMANRYENLLILYTRGSLKPRLRKSRTKSRLWMPYVYI
jgi:division protein 1